MTDQQKLTIEYMPLSDLLTRFHPQNPKLHDIGKISGSIDELDYRMPVMLDEDSGLLAAGHGRTKTLADMKRQQMARPEGVLLGDEGEWLVPTIRGSEFTPDKLKAYLVADNADDAGFDLKKLTELLVEVNNAEEVKIEATGFDRDDLDNFLEELNQAQFSVDKEAKPNPRNLPIDMIYTTDELYGAAAVIACKSGWLVGCRSVQGNGKVHTSIYQPERWQWRFNVAFVDNNYFDYVHDQHLEIVKLLKPKYCTVQDIMIEAQCRKDGITFQPFEQILDWAEELSQYAENVIVIPKYDCLDQIPDKFMLGYSVPTSHGGTPLPPESFKGRRVHLLGGSWKAQLAHMAVLGDDVVSVDNNYILKQARFGSFAYPDGRSGQITEDLGISPNNHLYVAMAISLGNIGAKINELYPSSQAVIAN